MTEYDTTDALRLIGLAHRAATEPEGWDRFLGEIRRTMGLGGLTLSFRPSATDPMVEGFATGRGLEYASLWNAYYVNVDPFAEAVQQSRERRLVGPGSECVPRDSLVKSEYYNGLVKAVGLEDSFAAIELSPRHGVTSLAGFTECGVMVTDADVELLQIIAPHFFQAVSLTRTFEELDFAREGACQALSHADFGCILLDGDARVVWMNRMSHDIVASGLSLRVEERRLGAIDARADVRLREAIRDALPLAAGEPSAPHPMFKVRRVDDGQPLELLISPLVTATLRPSGAAAMVIIADPTFVHEGLAGRLEQLHDLTPAEAEVAQWLLSGSSVNEIADMFGNSVHTIRTHLKRIFAKTNTSSQAQLVGTLQRSLARML